ncbi:MAG: translation initiation factor IF-1A [Nanoarchaeota archaeon]|nr:translation initiation factor IF-1A [Nanoarchaeota archaeon]
MEEKFGDFEEVKDQSQNQNTQAVQEFPTRIRFPRKGEVVGKVLQRLGGNRMEIKSTDGKTRNCRVPGRFKRKFWLRPGDYVIITPWPDDDAKGDIVFQYPKNSEHQLRKHNLLTNLKDEF